MWTFPFPDWPFQSGTCCTLSPQACDVLSTSRRTAEGPGAGRPRLALQNGCLKGGKRKEP